MPSPCWLSISSPSVLFIRGEWFRDRVLSSYNYAFNAAATRASSAANSGTSCFIRS